MFKITIKIDGNVWFEQEGWENEATKGKCDGP